MAGEREKARWQFDLSTLLAGCMFTALILGWWVDRTRMIARHQEETTFNTNAHQERVLDLERQVSALKRGRRRFNLTAEQPAKVNTFLQRGGGVEGDITKLSFAYGELTDQDLAIVSDLPTVRRIDVSGGKVDGKQKFGDAGFAHLAGCTHLESLTYMNSGLTDQGLSALGDLVSLRRLVLAGNSISDGGLTELDALTQLERLSLSFTQISDGTLAKVRNLKQLRRLTLDSTRITDDGMSHLATLESLEDLRLFDTAVGDRGLQHITQLRKLRYLMLSHTEVSDAGASALVALPLENLYLADTKVTDEGVRHLASLTTLKTLTLSGTDVSDDCVPLLGELRNLKQLRVAATQMTPAGATTLQELLPDCDIDSDRDSYDSDAERYRQFKARQSQR